jgi:recombination protein RecT
MSAQTVSNAVANRDETMGPIKFMWSKRSHLRTVLPRSVDIEAFLGTAAGALYASDVPGKSITLMKCAIASPDSLFVALMEAAALGHMPGTDEYYLTPRTDHGRLVVLGIEGYKGVVERMYRSGAVSNVVVREVCENDYFRYVEGEMDKPVHRFGGDGSTGKAFFATAGKRGEMVGGYAYAHLLTGAVSRVAIPTRDDVFAARDSGGYRASDPYSPWNRMDGGENHPEFKGRSMWWKTFAKRLEPWVPTSAEWRRESLRASASAVEHAAGRRELPELAAAAVRPGEAEYVDAVIVDDPDVPPAVPDATPSSGPAAAPPSAEVAAAGGTRPPQRASTGQVGLIVKAFERLTGVKHDDETPDQRKERLRLTSRLARVPYPGIGSTTELLSGQAKDVREMLARCETLADVEALLDSGALADDPREDGGPGE